MYPEFDSQIESLLSLVRPYPQKKCHKDACCSFEVVAKTQTNNCTPSNSFHSVLLNVHGLDFTSAYRLDKRCFVMYNIQGPVILYRTERMIPEHLLNLFGQLSGRKLDTKY